jgi:hypothetical protein
MAVRDPRTDLPVGLRGGSDTWDTQQAGALLVDDYFATSGSIAYTLTASGGSYALTGASATLTKSTASANYSLTALGGSYSLAGASATVRVGKRITTSGGSYSLVGQQATVRLGKRITATGGSYAVAGAQVTVRLGKRITATGGAYTLAGAQATVRRSRLLSASGGAYSISGASATIEIPSGPSNYSITAQGGGYVVNTSFAGIYVSGVSDTTGSRLVSLSGLAGVSAAAHLLDIRLSGATAGAMLVSRSTLGSASALAHLLDNGVAPGVSYTLTAQGGAYAVTGAQVPITVTQPIPDGGRRPKSTNTLKLRRIAEGKAWLVGSKAAARSNPVQAKGYAPEIVVPPVSSGRATALSGSCKSTSHNVRATGATRVTTLRSVSDTCAWRVTAKGVATASLKTSTTDSAAHTVRSSGGAASGLLSGSVSSMGELVLARGASRLSGTDIVVIAKMLTARDKVVY